ncbi:MAG: cysteine synthase A [Eubacteriales bacterium]|jgi:cysteine synthase A
MIAENLQQMIGNTPVFHFPGQPGMAELYAKLECKNPGGSVKDRVALSIIEEAERTGRLRPGGLIVEATSGSTGIGLSMLGTARGYRVCIVMPDNMSRERRDLMAAYGAELILTPAAQGMAGAVEKARQLVEENPGSLLADQFNNPANVAAHVATTGPEIWRDFGDTLDAVVAGVGTGGTLTGVAQYLKSQGAHTRFYAIQPESSPVLSGGKPGSHAIQGIGANFIPSIARVELFDEIVSVGNEEAMEAARTLGRRYGLLVGISSGAAWCAASRVARQLGEGKKVLFIAPDTGERYLSVL